MIVYEFIHTVYSYEDCLYDINETVLFYTYEDAFMYFECAMNKLIDEYIQEAHGEVGTIEEFEEYDEGYYSEINVDKDEPEKDEDCYWPRVYISLDDYGSDTIMIRKKNILRFN